MADPLVGGALVPVDLTRGERHSHPDIVVGDWYLVRHRGQLYAGRFEVQHYGLNFIGWVNPAGLQYDTPGTNQSGWEAVWKIELPDGG